MNQTSFSEGLVRGFHVMKPVSRVPTTGPYLGLYYFPGYIVGV